MADNDRKGGTHQMTGLYAEPNRGKEREDAEPDAAKRTLSTVLRPRPGDTPPTKVGPMASPGEETRVAVESPTSEEEVEEGPVEGYADLTAPQVAALLDEVDEETRDRILDYERAHKARKSIVG